MGITSPLLRHVWRWTWRLGTALLILCAVLLSGWRLLLPLLADHRPALEQMIGHYLNVKVRMEGLETAWQGWTPVLSLRGFTIRDSDSDQAIASFQNAQVSLDLWHSLTALRPVLGNLRLEGVQLTLESAAGADTRLLARLSDAPWISLQDLAIWFFHIKSLDLLSARLQWVDEAGDQPLLVIDRLALSLRSREHGWRLDLKAQLPESLGDRLDASIELLGQAEDPVNWRASFFARAGGVRFADGRLPLGAVGSRADISIWGDWHDREALNLLGKVRLRNPPREKSFALKTQDRMLADVSRCDIAFKLQRDGQGWRWQSDWSGFEEDRETIVQTTLDMALVREMNGRLSRIEVRSGDLRLQDMIAAVLPWLDHDQRELLLGLGPEGMIRDLSFSADLQTETPSSGSGWDGGAGCHDRDRACQLKLAARANRFDLQARFSGVSSRSKDSMPGLENLSGRLSLSQDQGRVDLDSREIKLNASSVLADPVAVDTLSGTVLWRQVAGGIRWEADGLTLANQALEASLEGSGLIFRDGTSPLLDLHLNYRNVDVRQIRHYLPVKVMHPKLNAWLDHALVSGTIPSGEMVFQGHTADFPFDKGQGQFSARFQVQDTILDYFPEWPRLEELEAAVSFHNRSLQVVGVAGKILEGDIRRVEARIDDLEDGVLEIRGESKESGAALMHFLRASPLVHRLGGYLNGMELQGKNTLSLALTIPLDHRPNQIQGTVNFTETSLYLAAWDIGFKRIQGALHFTEAGPSAKNIRLMFRGEPLLLDIASAELQNRRETRFFLRGRLGPGVLLGDRVSGLSEYIGGRSPWGMELKLVDGPSDDFDLTLYSDLKGVDITLPPPLAKTSEESRPVKLEIRRGTAADSLELKLDYAPDVRAMLVLADGPGGLHLDRGEMRIAAGEARLPNSPGLAVIARLARFEPFTGTQWRAVTIPVWLKSLQAQFGELGLGEQRFQKVSLTGSRTVDSVTAQVLGEDIAGQLIIPDKPTTIEPVTVELQRLAWKTTHQASPSQQYPPGPQSLPPLLLTVQDLSIDDIPLGSMRLLLTPSGDRQLTKLELRSDLYRVSADGDWSLGGESRPSNLHATFRSPDLGKTLKAFGYAVALEGGETQASLDATLPGPLLQLSPAALNGRLNLHIGKGRLPEVGPGVGRVFGLLNLGSLSRRLSLDFSDLFRQGLSFDSVAGSFTLGEGNAHTDDLTLKGPSARIHIAGRIGLVARDYDQLITVIPQMGSSLSLASALAGGPVVGAAVFLAENLFKKQIEEVASYQYTMTGSWDNPVITLKPALVSPSQPLGSGDK